MKIVRLFTLIITLLIAGQSRGQDIHFSQFYVSNLTLNPATVGVMSCQMRVSAIYRNQWGSVMGKYAFNTFGLGVEGKINAGLHDYVGVGLSVWVDAAGSSSLTSIHASVAGSYLKKIGGKRANEHYLVAGAQLGFIQRSMKLDALRWGTNWDGSQYDPSSGGGFYGSENFARTSLANFDLGAGLMWFSALDKENKSNVYAGIGFQHLTKMNVTALTSATIEELLFTKFTIHAGAEARIAKRLALVPNLAFWVQGPSFQMNAGVGVKFDFSKKAQSTQAFTLGVYMRGANQLIEAGSSEVGFGVDALIMLLRLRFGSSHIGFAYDINVSKLIAATRGNGAFELSYVWTLCNHKGRRLGCPAF
jgi:type IX secretion system PorP/SprF family membrane protein